MPYTIVPFSPDLVESAVGLFAATYANARDAVPMLPPDSAERRQWITAEIRGGLTGSGAALLDGEELVGYMLATPPFAFKAQRASMIRDFAHSSIERESRCIYQLLYPVVAEELRAQGANLHLIGHFSHDAVLTQTLFELGFGAVVEEELRTLTPIPRGDLPAVDREFEASRISSLIQEQARYYESSPIFIAKHWDDDTVPIEPPDGDPAGNALFVHREDGLPVAYLVVGRCSGIDEGFLLQRTNTAEVLTAYAQPAVRGRGVGKALLSAAIEWTSVHGFERLFVEHEAANVIGGNFWQRHFSSYLWFSMRYTSPCRPLAGSDQRGRR